MTWRELYRWVCLTLLNNPDNLIYYFTSVAFKNENKILQTTKETELRNALHVCFPYFAFNIFFKFISQP